MLLLSLILPASFPRLVEARSREVLNKDNLELILKGVVSLYLLNRLNSVLREEPATGHQSLVAAGYRQAPPLAGKIIILDPGHGGSDPGAVGARGLKEKDVNLDIAKRVYRLLKENTGAQVYLTRDTDRFISLAERFSLANRLDGDIF